MKKRWQLDRRAFLRGSGALIGLPLLEAMFPTDRAFAQSGAPQRLVYLFYPNGSLQDTWNPSLSGSTLMLSDQLSSLESHKGDLTFFRGLYNRNGDIDGNGDHARGAAVFLTCRRAVPSGSTLEVGTSADQVVAQAIGTQTPLRSLVTGAPDANGGAGYFADTPRYAAEYSANISWEAADRPAPRILGANNLFNRVFPAGSTGGGTPPPPTTTQRQSAIRKSILDATVAEVSSLRTRLGTRDQQKVDQYLTGIREVERSIQSTTPPPTMACSPGTAPANTSNFPTTCRQIMDIMILAMQCDRTRVLTYMLDYEGSGRSFPWAGADNNHHDVSHYNDNPNVYRPAYQRITKWYADQFAYFVGRLKAVSDANGPLINNTMCLIGSGMHDGNNHGNENLPVILAGRGGGIQPGRIINPGRVPLANLHLSLIRKMGVNASSHGDSTGTISGL